VDRTALVHFWRHDLFRSVGWAMGLGLVGLVVGWRWARTSTAWAFWATVVAGFIATAWISRLHSGGGRDVLIPAYVAVALLAGLGYDALRRAPTRRPGLLGAVLAVVVVVQLVWLGGHPAHLVPNAASTAAGRRFVAMVAALPGPVIVYDHPWYETMAGKPSWADGEAVNDVLRAGPGPARQDLLASISSSLSSGRVTEIFLDDEGDAHTLGVALEGFYAPGAPVFSCDRCFFPVTDLAVRPALRYVRRPAPTG